MTKKEMLDQAFEHLSDIAADNSFGVDMNINRAVPALYNTLRLVCAYLQELENDHEPT